MEIGGFADETRRDMTRNMTMDGCYDSLSVLFSLP